MAAKRGRSGRLFSGEAMDGGFSGTGRFTHSDGGVCGEIFCGKGSLVLCGKPVTAGVPDFADGRPAGFWLEKRVASGRIERDRDQGYRGLQQCGFSGSFWPGSALTNRFSLPFRACHRAGANEEDGTGFFGF